MTCTSEASGLVPWSAQLRWQAQRWGDALAVDDTRGQTLTHAQLSQRAHAWAQHLVSAGVQPGDPIATLLPNGLSAVWASLGLRLHGACEVTLGWVYTDEELLWAKTLGGVQRVLTTPDQRERMQALGFEVWCDDAVSAADHGQVMPPIPASIRSRIMFTSGTTGKPKAVVYDHGRRWLGELQQLAHWDFKPGPGDAVLLMTPYIHGSGLLASAWMSQGGLAVVAQGADGPRVLPWLTGERNQPGQRLRAVFAPPTVLAKLHQELDRSGAAAVAPVEVIFTGTQPLTPGLHALTQGRWGDVIRITYGKTECINPITVLPPHAVAAGLAEGQRLGGACVGWPALGVEIRLGPPDGQISEARPEQEVWLRAAHMSNGLIDAQGWRDHECQGWHATGDLGAWDDQGRLHLVGRMADVMKTGGYKVNPDEIEATLSGMPECPVVAITSVPSEYWGEVLVVVAEQPMPAWVEAVKARVASLSSHKRPRLFVALNAFDRNAQGKVSRRRLREQVLAAHTFTDGPHPALAPWAGSTP